MTKVQVLVATMFQSEGDHSLLERMNIQSDAIVCNQCERNVFEEFSFGEYQIRFLSFAERGVGLNRNNALMRATAEYVLFADDDMIYADGYVQTVQKAFEELPKADVIIFNLDEENTQRYIIKKKKRVGKLNYLRYGTARIAVKLDSVKARGLYFNQCFGGGTEHCHGEDNLFLSACLKNGLKIYSYPETIARLSNERDSSWFCGYDEKYLRDQGALYKTISRKWWRFLCFQDAIRHHKSYSLGWHKAYALMCSGAKRTK